MILNARQQEFIQVDTTNILFIVGGAFVGLDKVIENRVSNRSLGIAANIRTKAERLKEETNMLQRVEPDDLVKFGLIPEFIGRLPTLAVLDPLDEAALIDILIRPKNALTKQYQKLFAFENVDLKFEDSALRAVAQQAIARNTGARGLRGVIENSMLDIMYEIPSQPNVRECIITEDVILKKDRPQLVLGKEPEKKKSGSGSEDDGSAESA